MNGPLLVSNRILEMAGAGIVHSTCVGSSNNVRVPTEIERAVHDVLAMLRMHRKDRAEIADTARLQRQGIVLHTHRAPHIGASLHCAKP